MMVKYPWVPIKVGRFARFRPIRMVDPHWLINVDPNVNHVLKCEKPLTLKIPMRIIENC